MNIINWQDQISLWNQSLRESRQVLEDLRNRYYGKRCFIIGNGPSLNQVDWSLLKDEYTFGLNRIYLLFEKMGFVPSFYLCMNSLVIEQSIDEIQRISSQKFLPSNHIQLVKNPGETTFFKTSHARFFSYDLTEEVSQGHTVTYAALQFAYYMGFRQVVLIGVDHYFRTEGTPNSIVVSESDDPNHFAPNYFGKGVRWQLPDLQNSEKSYKLAKSTFEADGRVVLDGTINGRLTVFPKIDYRDVFTEQQKVTTQMDAMSMPIVEAKYQLGKKPSANKNYKVSAIVSTYNAEKYLRGCLEDLENQTLASVLEIVVIDSGSQQNEAGIVREFQKEYDNILYFRTEQRETLYQAWNRGIQAAHGEYITNANTDDHHMPDALEKMAQVLDSRPDVVLVYADQDYFKEENEKEIFYSRQRIDFSRWQLYEQCFIGSQPMWRKSVHSDIGYFDETFFSAGDYEFWLRLSQKYLFLHINETLGGQLVRQDSLEYEDGSFTSHFETATILKCYKYALLYDIHIDARGISEHPMFLNWCEINLLKRNTYKKLTNSEPDAIERISDWRKNLSKPKLSIVIATYQREKDLLLSLYELNSQHEKSFEVIIVNNGPEMEVFDNLPLGVTYDLCFIQLNANYGPSLARNIGAANAHGEIVALLDDDALPTQNWTSRILHHFSSKNIIGLRGRVLPKQNQEYMHIPRNYDFGDSPCINDAGLEMGAAYRKAEFLRVGGYNEYLYHLEGAELSYRLAKANGNRLDCILYFPDIVIYHDTYPDANHLAKKMMRNAENKKMIGKMMPGFIEHQSFFWRVYKQDVNNYNWYKYLMDFCYSDNPRLVVEFATQAIQYFPILIEPYQFLGGAYFRLGNWEKSAAAFRIVSELLIEQLRIQTIKNSLDELKKAYTTTVLKIAYVYFKSGMKQNAFEALENLEKNEAFCLFDQETNKKQEQILALLEQL